MRYKITFYAFVLILSIFGLSYIFENKDINDNDMENRTMASFEMVLHPVENSVTYRESLLERFEEALKDQMVFRDYAVSCYLKLNDFLSNNISSLFLAFVNRDNDNNQYTYETIGSYIKIDGSEWIGSLPKVEELDTSQLQIHIDQIERIHNLYPQINFYNYYVTQINDTGWFDNFLGATVPSIYEQIIVLLPSYVHSSRLTFEDLEDYKNVHYRTDHHWNHIGARRGYENIYNMMSENLGLSKIRIPVSETSFTDLFGIKYKGSYANNLKNIYSGSDEFAVYEYDIPERTVSVIHPDSMEEIYVWELSLWDEYKNGDIDSSEYKDHYITFYGNAKDKDGNYYKDSQYIFKIQNYYPESKHNILVCGDSYNRAFRDVLASHFDTAIFLDYRIMSKVYIDELIDKYHIDTLLLSGHDAIWVSDEYVFSFSDVGGNK